MVGSDGLESVRALAELGDLVAVFDTQLADTTSPFLDPADRGEFFAVYGLAQMGLQIGKDLRLGPIPRGARGRGPKCSRWVPTSSATIGSNSSRPAAPSSRRSASACSRPAVDEVVRRFPSARASAASFSVGAGCPPMPHSLVSCAWQDGPVPSGEQRGSFRPAPSSPQVRDRMSRAARADTAPELRFDPPCIDADIVFAFSSRSDSTEDAARTSSFRGRRSLSSSTGASGTRVLSTPRFHARTLSGGARN